MVFRPGAPSRLEERGGMLWVELLGPKAAGRWFQADISDRNLLEGRRWMAKVNSDRLVYAYAKEGWKTIFAHRLISAAEKGQYADHRDRDTLNNRRGNLRACTSTENARNKSLSRRNSSGIRGVRWKARQSKWEAFIHIDSKLIVLGSFAEKAHAAAARRIAAIGIYGEFAGIEGMN